MSDSGHVVLMGELMHQPTMRPRQRRQGALSRLVEDETVECRLNLTRGGKGERWEM